MNWRLKSLKLAAPVAVLLGFMSIVQVLSIRQEAQTWDEGTHLAAGLSYWKTGDYRMNPEHPPLAKLLCAVPLLFMDVTLPFQFPAWQERNEVDFGAYFLYTNRLPADAILFPARCVTILLTLALGISIAVWTRWRFGAAAALFAVALVAFDPNLIAHGRYVTTDLAVTLFSFLACIAWEWALRRKTAGGFVIVGVLLGLALGSKFSALFLIPVFVILGFARRPGRKGALLTAGIAVAVVVGLYGPGGPGLYWQGLSQVFAHNKEGHTAYLLGQISQKGWWYYFPVAFLVKTPTAVLLLCLAALFYARRVVTARFEYAVMAVPLVVYSALAFGASLDIGFRHLLPVLPFLYVQLGVVAARMPRWLSGVLVLLLLAESLSVYPHYLAFFNRVSGGPANGPTYLLDSNIDWGQDTKKLKAWLDARDVHRICDVYFGEAFPGHYGIETTPLPGNDEVEARNSLDCVAAASVTPLYGLYVENDRYSWLRQLRPVAKVGYSIYVYDLRKRH
ncbi:MAG TPA: glycosyltransferase family 39 protein [Bryobacteraceae bacterium]|nr:glycosyltransferase family 39 protein [Bryobacteraceae bacterium]